MVASGSEVAGRGARAPKGKYNLARLEAVANKAAEAATKEVRDVHPTTEFELICRSNHSKYKQAGSEASNRSNIFPAYFFII